MKLKQTLLMIMISIFLLPLCAGAETQEEWNLSCTRKTKSSTVVYKNGTDNDILTTIPAGTYVKITGEFLEQYEVTHMIDGTKGSGRVDQSAVIVVVSQYRGSDGYAHNVHELDPEHDAILKDNPVQFIAPSLLEESDKDYTSMVTFFEPGGRPEQEAREAAQRMSGDTENTGDASGVDPPASDSQPGDSPADTSKPSASTPAADPAPKPSASSQSKPSAEEPAPDSTVQSDNAVKVSLQTVGTYQTSVVMNGEKQAVMTANLSFGEDVPADKALAVAYAPRTGKISLRDSASDGAYVAGQLKAGQVVAVMRYGQSYCYVSSGSKSGYAKTASLRFHAPIAEETGAASAQLSYKGKTNGSTTINIRLDADKDSHKIGEFRTGTPVIVLGSANGWTQIEVNGLRGYVMDEFVTAAE